MDARSIAAHLKGESGAETEMDRQIVSLGVLCKANMDDDFNTPLAFSILFEFLKLKSLLLNLFY